MKKDVVPVQIRGIFPYLAGNGTAIFIGNEEKVFIISVDTNMARVIGDFLADTPKERPLTHDLVVNIMRGFGTTLERVVITDLRNSTYFARLTLMQQNELGKKMVEIDARPSDCLALAAAHKRPVFVAQGLFDKVEDATETLERLTQESQSGGGESESESEA
ncbi:MAG: bifunctional nuclease family protein [Verrucomicrobia bacterium]|nr:bifunctional nuclease family protein [Verrucomicrobiota bacterium]